MGDDRAGPGASGRQTPSRTREPIAPVDRLPPVMTVRPRPSGIAALSLALFAGLVLGACSGSVSAPDPSAPGSPAPVASGPADGSGGGADPGGGGGVPGDPGSGVGIAPVGPQPVNPGPGEPTVVRPVPGRADPHPVVPIRFETSIDGRHVLVRVSWYGGVEPCSVLDSVKVERTGGDITVTPIEGSSAAGQNVACIDIALLKATIVDLGELEPGTYRITSPGSDAQPAVFTIA
jgi:hypothetical protein